MTSSPSNQENTMTFHQWVESRIQEMNFHQHPVVGPNSHPWTLEADVSSYHSMLSRISAARATEFLALWERVAGAATPRGVSAVEREWRDRRQMYGRSPDLSSQMRVSMHIHGHDLDLETRVLDNPPHLMTGISPKDLAEVAELQSQVLHISWSSVVLDSPLTQAQLEMMSCLNGLRNTIQSEIDSQILVNRQLEEDMNHQAQAVQSQLEDEAMAGARVERAVRFLDEPRRGNGPSQGPSSSDDEYELSEGDLEYFDSIFTGEEERGGEGSGWPSWEDEDEYEDSEDEGLEYIDFDGDTSALLEQLMQSDSEDDEDSYVTFRSDWFGDGNILEDCPHPHRR